MKRKGILALGLVWMFGGCAGGPSGVPGARTLENHPLVPKETLRLFYEPERWREIRSMEYDGLVVLRGRIRRDRTVEVSRVHEAYPNNSRNAAARRYAEGIRIRPISVGTRVPAQAEVYVFFYETNRFPHEAIVVARQIGTAAPAYAEGGDFYLNHIFYGSLDDFRSRDATITLDPRQE